VITFHLEELPSDGAELRSLLVALRARGEPFVKLQLDPQVPSNFAATVLRVADSLGLRVGGHLPFTLDLAASQVGYVSVEHDWTLLPQCSRASPSFDDRTDSKTGLLDAWDDARCDTLLSSMRARGTAYVPTHVASTGQDIAFAAGPPASGNTHRYVTAPQRFAWSILRAAGKVDERDTRVLRAYHATALRLTKRAVDAGVIVLAGSDALDPEVLHGFGLHDELQYLVNAGLSPGQALAAATTVPAQFFDGDGGSGRIAAGQRADLVLLDANPLLDIRSTRRIHGVLADGRWFGPAERMALLQFVEVQAHRWTVASRFLRGLWYGG
jgi:Amidohydrolase family